MRLPKSSSQPTIAKGLSVGTLFDKLTVKEVAAELKVDPETVRRYIRRGILKAHKIPGAVNYYVFRRDLEAVFVLVQEAPDFTRRRSHGV